jgi:hypothetical protein
MASTQRIEIYQGEAVTLNFTLAPVENIAGWTLLFTAAEYFGSAAKLFSQAGEIVSAANGTFKVDLPASKTDIAHQKVTYDVWRTDTGFERVLAAGILNILGTARLPPSP